MFISSSLHYSVISIYSKWFYPRENVSFKILISSHLHEYIKILDGTISSLLIKKTVIDLCLGDRIPWQCSNRKAHLHTSKMFPVMHHPVLRPCITIPHHLVINYLFDRIHYHFIKKKLWKFWYILLPVVNSSSFLSSVTIIFHYKSIFF